MRFVLLLSVSVLALSPAFAAGEANTITVIGDDGKAVTVEMDAAEPVLPGPEPKAAPAPFDIPPVKAAPPVVETIEKPAIQTKTEKPKTEKPKTDKPKKPAAKNKEKKKSTPPVPPVEPKLKEVQRDLPPSGPISEDMAVSIAVENAPPSSGYEVSRTIYQNSRAYLVTFKTENGLYDVVLDGASGAVLFSGPASVPPPAPTPPGHLPK